MDEADLKRLEELNKKEKLKEASPEELAELEKKHQDGEEFAKKWAGVLLIGMSLVILFQMGFHSMLHVLFYFVVNNLIEFCFLFKYFYIQELKYLQFSLL